MFENRIPVRWIGRRGRFRGEIFLIYHAVSEIVERRCKRSVNSAACPALARHLRRHNRDCPVAAMPSAYNVRLHLVILRANRELNSFRPAWNTTRPVSILKEPWREGAARGFNATHPLQTRHCEETRLTRRALAGPQIDRRLSVWTGLRSPFCRY